MTTEDRFWSKVVVGEECWEWSGRPSSKGYGLFYFDGRAVQAHRYSYEISVGKIPDGLQIDHLCRNRICVRPEHLEPVTLQENIRRGETGKYLSDRKSCKYGHDFSKENTRINSRGARICRECARIRNKKLRSRSAQRYSSVI